MAEKTSTDRGRETVLLVIHHALVSDFQLCMQHRCIFSINRPYAHSSVTSVVTFVQNKSLINEAHGGALKGARCSSGKVIQTQDVNIYNINEVITHTQK